MNLYVLLIALLCISLGASVNGRAIDDVDNSIETNEEGQQQQGSSAGFLGGNSHARFEQDWLRFTKAPPAKLYQQLGTPVEIVCEVFGSQIPVVTWVVAHSPLTEDPQESNVISEASGTAIARVRSVYIVDHMLGEPRTYTCIGRTGSKTIYASTIVYPQADIKDSLPLNEKSFLGPHKPRIIYSEKIHLDLVDSNVVLPCKVHARPRAEVFWMNGEGKLIEQNQRFRLLPNGDLLIAELKWEDMGAYKCIARNAVGKDTAETFVYPVLKEGEK